MNELRRHMSQRHGYMRREETASFLGISLRTLGSWQRRRLIPFHKVSRRVCLFKVSDLEAALARFRTTAVGEGPE